MHGASKLRKRVYVSAVALGLAFGSVGVAAAATHPPAPTSAPEEAVDSADPGYVASITVPQAQVEGVAEADETAALERLATIGPDEASAAATGAVPGVVGKVELDNENGSVVYSVEITDASGGQTDVKVDAGNGTVLDRQAGTEDEAEGGKAAEADDEAEERSGTEADTDGVEHESQDEGEHDDAGEAAQG